MQAHVSSSADFRDETLEERLDKLYLYPDRKDAFAMTISKTLPEHTEAACEQVDGREGIEYRSCRVKNLCFALKPLRWFYLRPSIFVKDEKKYAVNVGGSPGYIMSTLLRNITYDPQEAIEENDAVLHVHTPAMLFARYLPGNFYHRLHDDFLPLVLQMAAYADLNKRDGNVPRLLVFADRFSASFDNTLHDPFGSVLHIDQFGDLNFGPNMNPKIVCFSNAFVGTPSKSLWFQSAMHSSVFKPEDVFPPSVTDRTLTALAKWVRKIFDIPSVDAHSTSKLYKALLSNPTGMYPQSIPRLKLTVIRRERYRKIRNETALLDALKSAFPMVDVVTFSEEHYSSSKDIISAAAGSFAIIGVHGALLASAIFMPKGSMLVEIMPFAVSNTVMGYYKTLGNFPTLGLHYRGMMSAGGDEHGPWDQERVNCLDVLPPSYQQGVKSNSSIPNFPCCFNIFWHYRSGQDVEADIPFVIRSLKEMMLEQVNKS